MNDNHEDPNLKVVRVPAEGMVWPTFFSTRLILPGEELTYDYGGNGDMYWWRQVSGVILQVLMLQEYIGLSLLSVYGIIRVSHQGLDI